MDGISVFSAAINGKMEMHQCSDEYPSGEGLNGIILAGSAASPSKIFGRRGFGDDAKSEMAISTGSTGG